MLPARAKRIPRIRSVVEGGEDVDGCWAERGELGGESSPDVRVGAGGVQVQPWFHGMVKPRR